MLGQLPKLIDRNFFIGFFLPVVVFAAVSYGLTEAFDLAFLRVVFTNATALTGTVISLLLVWLIAVLLLAANRSLYRLLEGYGLFNPFRLLTWKERRRYRRLVRDNERIEEAFYKSNDQATITKLRARRSKIQMMLAESFPLDERSLLPTRFGNTIRAFEDYPRVVYGLDATRGWNRLLAVVPKDFREVVNEAKAQTDLWLNLWALSLLSLMGYAACTFYAGLAILWFPLATAFVAWFAAWRARTSAFEWGDAVKASFDTFMQELATKLSFPSTVPRENQAELWTLFSQVFVYRSREALGQLNQRIDELSQYAPDGASNSIECIYTVQEGDTLEHVAQRFGITVEELARVNRIRNSELISVGQKLKVWPK